MILWKLAQPAGVLSTAIPEDPGNAAEQKRGGVQLLTVSFCSDNVFGMPRRARKAPGGMVFHCINRGNDRREISDDWGDYAAFERVMEHVVDVVPMRILS